MTAPLKALYAFTNSRTAQRILGANFVTEYPTQQETWGFTVSKGHRQSPRANEEESSRGY